MTVNPAHPIQNPNPLLVTPSPFLQTATAPAAVVPFPPHPDLDLVDRLEAVRAEWRRDNGYWCLTELRDILDEYPWSKEAADLYGLMHSKLHHIFSRKGLYNLSEWIAIQNMAKMSGWVHRADDGLTRYRLMKDAIKDFLDAHNPQMVPVAGSQWADLADVGAQHGEMTINWIGLTGMRYGFALELSPTNCQLGKKWYHDLRLHHMASFADELPLKSESVHVVVVSGLLEHVLDYRAIMVEAERVVKPGGLVIIQVPYGGGESANPAADTLSWRSHVQCLDPNALVAGKREPSIQYISYRNSPSSPFTWEGETGDFVITYKKDGELVR